MKVVPFVMTSSSRIQQFLDDAHRCRKLVDYWPVSRRKMRYIRAIAAIMVAAMGDVTKLVLREDAGWDASNGAILHHVVFDPALFAAAPATLGPGAFARYRELASEPGYLGWWADACGGSAPGLRRFAVETGASHWERPWEATISALQQERWPDVAMLRLVPGKSASVAPREPGSPLRMLVIQGQEADEHLGTLDLAAELAALRQASAQLDAAAQAIVSLVEARPSSHGDLIAALAETKPAILWLSGHATENPAGFLLADGSWLTPDLLASSIIEASKGSGSVPLYVVLWACKTGLNERFAAPRAAPPFIAALGGAGVSAVLATLGPLADDIAPGFAADVFGAIAAGRPLDHGVARARAALMAQQLPDGHRDDWACPVVWCADLPSDEVVWSRAAEPVQRQSLARRLLPDGLVPSEFDEAAAEQTRLWSQHRRIWVCNRASGAFQVRSEWLARALGQQTVGTQMVIALDFRDGSARNVLRDWARTLMRQTDGFDDPDRRFRELAAIVDQDPESGWRALCERGTVTLALLDPPEKEGWLWDGLRGRVAAAIVLAESFPGDAAADDWKVEELSPAAAPAGFDPLQHPLAPALAVLAFPAAEPDLVAIDASEVQALKQAGYLIQTRGGCVMPFSRAASFVDRLDSDQVTAAHRCAFAMLDGEVARARIAEGANEALLKARLHHAANGRDPAALGTSAQELMERYRYERRAGALLDVFGQVDYRQIDERWKISAGWACLQTGSPDSARDWLELADDDQLDVIDQATKHGLIAEVEKSSGDAGSYARARGELELALGMLTAGTDDTIRARLRIQHDLARLTHFLDGDPAAAIPQYKAVYDSWRAFPHSALDQAVTLRNLAEARMMLADKGASDRGALFDAASDDIATARDALPPHTGHTVAAELEYVAGRLALRRGDDSAATSSFNQAKSVGLATNHLMLVAIVEARMFWREVAGQAVDLYDPGQWKIRADRLSPFVSHAWAARVIIDGHLRSAHKLVDAGYYKPAISALRASQSLLLANPAFDDGSDRDRIMATCAGLAITGEDAAPWEGVTSDYDWAGTWLAKRDAATAEKVWETTR